MPKVQSNFIRCLLYLAGIFLPLASGQQHTFIICDEARARGFLLADDGIYLRQRDLVTEFLMDEHLLSYLERLNNLLAELGTILVLTPVPTKAMVIHNMLDLSDPIQASYDASMAHAAYSTFLELLEQRGILAADLLTPTLATDWGSMNEWSVMPSEIHWTPSGAQVAARAVADVIAAHPKYSELPQGSFQTSTRIVPERHSLLIQHIEEECQFTIPKRELTHYVTANRTAALDLFGQSYAPIVLAGTSYSNPFFNFSGFISEFLSVEVENMFIPAGGLFSSLEDYLLGELYDESKPAFLIWEFPFLYLGESREQVFQGLRRIIPSLYGSCVDSIASTTINAVETETVLLSHLANLNIQGSSYYLHLQASDLSLTEFTVTFIHADGTIDVIDVARTTRVQNSGHYFIELSAIASPLETIHISIPGGSTGNIEAKICR